MTREQDNSFHFEVLKTFGVLGQKSNGWTKELNLVSWNGREAKLDIRDWSPDKLRMSKGITIDKEEARNLQSVLPGALA
jgi:hypothetical protein